MAATFTPLPLSGSTGPLGISITSTGIATAQTLHSGSTGPTTVQDDVDLYAAANGDVSDVLTLCPNTTSTSLSSRYLIPGSGAGAKYLGRWRLPGSGSTSPITMKAYTSTTTAAGVVVWGGVTRYTT